jgi:hypothetical protein
MPNVLRFRIELSTALYEGIIGFGMLLYAEWGVVLGLREVVGEIVREVGE